MESGGNILMVEDVCRGSPSRSGNGSQCNNDLLLLIDHGKWKRLSILTFSYGIGCGDNICTVSLKFIAIDHMADSCNIKMYRALNSP